MRTVLATTPYEPSMETWINAIGDNPFYILSFILFYGMRYWQWTLGLILVAAAVWSVNSTKNDKQAPLPNADAANAKLEEQLQENYEKLTDIIDLFVEAMDEVGNPELSLEAFKSLKSEEGRAAHWGFTPARTNVPLDKGSWYCHIAPTSIVITPKGGWLLFGSYLQSVYAHGQDREIGIMSVMNGSNAQTAISEKTLDNAAQALDNLLSRHNPSALEEFHDILNSE